MTNKEKLIELMKEYNIHTMLYPTGMDLNEDEPDGELIFLADENISFSTKVFNLYTECGVIAIDQDFHVRMLREDLPTLDLYTRQCTEVLYVE